MNKEYKVERIKKEFVSSDCVQVSIPFDGTMTFLSTDGIIFYNDKDNIVNKYLSDDRRRRFAEADVAIYSTWNGLLKRESFTKQILDFNRPYISIQNGEILERFVIKDNDEALLISKILNFERKTVNMNYKQLSEMVFDNNNCDNIFYIYLDGSIPSDHRIYPTENEIYDGITGQLREKMENFKKYQKEIEHYSEVDRWFYDYVNKSIENIDLSLVNFNFDVGKSLVIIKIKDNLMKVFVVEATLVNYDNFKVDVYNMLVNSYTLEQVKASLNDSKDSMHLNYNMFHMGLVKRKVLKK